MALNLLVYAARGSLRLRLFQDFAFFTAFTKIVLVLNVLIRIMISKEQFETFGHF